MTSADRRIAELAEQFRDLTIKKQMKILAYKASRSRLYFKEILEEFEKTLLQAILEKYDYNILKMSMDIKLHRNTIYRKMVKLKIIISGIRLSVRESLSGPAEVPFFFQEPVCQYKPSQQSQGRMRHSRGKHSG